MVIHNLDVSKKWRRFVFLIHKYMQHDTARICIDCDEIYGECFGDAAMCGAGDPAFGGLCCHSVMQWYAE